MDINRWTGGSLRRSFLPFAGAPALPPAVAPFRARGRRAYWPLAVLLLSIGLTAVAAFDAQRVVRNQRQVAERALREYASFAAWSYAEHLGLKLDAVAREVLGAVNHGDQMHTSPHVPTAHHLPMYLDHDAACDCVRTRSGPSPDAFFALDLRPRTLSEDHNLATAGAGSVYRSDAGASGDPRARSLALSDAFRAWLADSLAARVRAGAGMARGFRFVVEGRAGARRIFAYTLMPMAWGDTMVYGAVYSRDAFARVLADVLDSPGLLPEAFVNGRRNRDVISLAVRDAAGLPLFTTAAAPTALSARVRTAPSLDTLGVEAAVRPAVAGTLIIGGLPPTGMAFPIGLLALAAALSVIAVVQIRREGELARLRAGFVSSVSHELRTPVAQIRLYLETLRLGRATTPAQREWALGHIERETQRLAYLVENVLRFSTLDEASRTSGRVDDPAAAVRDIVAEFEPLARSRGVSLELRAAPAPPVNVRADALRHILLNLLDNAVKYGPPEQTVQVSVCAAGGQVTIAVQDEGPGIPPAEREAVWRAFARSSTAAASGGSGLGLTIVRELARAQGGSARIDAAAARGTRFVVSFPPADDGGPPAAR